MSRVGYQHSVWGGHRRRIGAASYGPPAAGVLLGLVAVTEAVVRLALIGASAQRVLVLCLIALLTTVPVAVLGPGGAALAVTSSVVLSLGLFHTLTAGGLAAQLFVLFRLAAGSSQHDGVRLLALGLAMPFLVLALARPSPTGSEAGILTVLLASVAPAAAGAGIARRARIEALMHRDAWQSVAGDRHEHLARAERARIARELHDVVAHHISMISVQAETARLTTPGMPAAGAQRLSAIGDTARSALTEMRRLLGVLREDTDTGAADLRPQPGLEQLNELLDEARNASGTATRLILRGSPVALDPGVELAAYRIVQEALTNARRHAPGAGVDVELQYGKDALRLRVRDNGPGPPESASPSGGHGLSGMGERAAAVGGEARSGPAAGGGFLVEATLPVDAETLA